jgi:predicted regulator of Ras-like GTPase activity (Roadblock/LC7/MglB family)
MDATEALADLTEISSQIEHAVIFREDTVEAATLEGERGGELARLARELIVAGECVRRAETSGGLTQLHVASARGSVFVVRRGGQAIAATTRAAPPAGLVLHDLRACLRSLDDAERSHVREEAHASS